MKRDNQTKNLSLLLVLCLCLSFIKADFFMDCLWWYWHRMVFSASWGTLLNCFSLGWWFGLFFFNDFGKLTQDCLDVFGGGSYVDFTEYLDVYFD